MNTRSVTSYTNTFLWTSSLLLAGNTLAVDTTKLNRMSSHRRQLFSEPFPNANIDDFAITYHTDHDTISSSSSSDSADYNSYYDDDYDDDEFIDILFDKSYMEKMKKYKCVKGTKKLYTIIRDEYNIDPLDVYPICTSANDDMVDEWNSFLTCDYTKFLQDYEPLCHSILDGQMVTLDMTHYCTVNTYFKTNVPFCVSKECVDDDGDDTYLNKYLEEDLIDLVAEEGALLDDDAIDPCPIFVELSENDEEDEIEESQMTQEEFVEEEGHFESSQCIEATITDIQSNEILGNFWDESVKPHLQEICNENRSLCNFHSFVTQYKELCQSDQVGGVFIPMDMKCHHSYYDTIAYEDVGYPMCISPLCPLNDGYVEVMEDMGMHWMKEFECEVRLSEITSSEKGAASFAI